MNNITLPKPLKLVKKEGNQGVFEINDIYPGYGVTLANALRRVLLSSLPGAAITSVKIKSAQHEFSTLPHVREDILEIILNLKQIRFRHYADEPIKLNIFAKGEKKITAADIKTKGQIEVINADAHIATLTNKSAELDMDLTVEKGLGYVQVDTRAKNKKEIGVIAMDAIFSPVKRVSYDIENVRVGQMTDYNKIILELETDGSISPEEALAQTIEILIRQFEALKAPGEAPGEKPEIAAPEPEKKTKEEKAEAGESVLLKPAEEIGFSARTLAALRENKLKTIGAIARKTEKELLEMDKMGKVAVKEIKKGLGKLGIVLKQ